MVIAVLAATWAVDQYGSTSPAQSRTTTVQKTLEPTPTPIPLPSGASPKKTKSAAAKKKVTIPTQGSGTFDIAAGGSPIVGAGRSVTYRVEVESGVPISADEFASAVDSTLSDQRGWTKKGTYAIQRNTTSALRIVLATPATTDRLCAPLLTRGEVSCRNGNNVVINAVRWVDGASSYAGDLKRYRQYVVNHEFGHSLGFGHVGCPSPGADAPVMLQQTRGLEGCVANPWP